MAGKIRNTADSSTHSICPSFSSLKWQKIYVLLLLHCAPYSRSTAEAECGSEYDEHPGLACIHVTWTSFVLYQYGIWMSRDQCLAPTGNGGAFCEIDQ